MASKVLSSSTGQRGHSDKQSIIFIQQIFGFSALIIYSNSKCMRYITSRHHLYIIFTPPAQKCKSYSCLYPFLRDLFSSKLWGKLNCSIMIEKNLKVAKKRPVSIHWNSWEIVWFFSSIGIVCCLCNCLAFLCSFSAKMVHQERVCVCVCMCAYSI